MHSIEAFYFGESKELFGIYTPADGVPKSQGVLICPPLFQEYYKTHFTLRKVAQDLSEKGFDVLRFDYAGTGDSFGDYQEVTLETWEDNISTAAAELKALSGVQSVSLIAVRFAASLLKQVHASAAHTVLWDPLLSGSEYLQHLRETQIQLVQKHHDLDESDRSQFETQELVGSAINESLVDQMDKHTRVSMLESGRVTLLMTKGRRSPDGFLNNANTELLELDTHCPWEDADLRMLYPHDLIKALVAAL